MFYALDIDAKDHLTLKDLMGATAVGLMMPHSLPALYFFDNGKDGTLTHAEFVELVHFCHSEKRKVEAALSHDKPFRDLILRASKAGVKDCSLHGRSSFRRFSSYSNVRSVFSSREVPSPATTTTTATSTVTTPPSATATSHGLPGPSAAMPPPYPTAPPGDNPIISRSPSESSDERPIVELYASCPQGNDCHPHQHGSESSVSSDHDESRLLSSLSAQDRSVAMYASQCEFKSSSNEDVDDEGTPDPDYRDPENRTALDAAVLENIMHANIHKLADLLHTEGSREQFMAWLWNLADFNSSGVVTLEELRVFLAALDEDGIDLEELVFYKEVGIPLEECIINEFDTTHAGLLSRDEFMVLADLVTREYEFWENRHLERIGDYELGRTIGRGSSGVVRLAMHVGTREKVAIKIIKKGKCSDMSRLDREIQSLMAARHEHIVALKEVLDSQTNLFLVMELCGGGSLVDIVRLYPEERMPEETARFFMRQVFEALAFCHRNGICHRDVRLDNLLLDNAGNVKITDFGHSGIYTPGWDLFSTSLVGSVYNLSPEQITGQLYSGEKIDIWSAGVAVYCLLVGRPPFFEPDVTPLLESITKCDFATPDFLSPKANDLIHCMIRAVPEERITIQQMLHHPWFYDGPEYGPSMDVVVIPVDVLFTKRPGIAEMIMAITIYQHNLHFHFADTHNPKSSPEDQRGQEWTMKCLCPKNDIKFTVSLFIKEPESLKTKKKKPNEMSPRASCSALPDGFLGVEHASPALRRAGSAGSQQQRVQLNALTKHMSVGSSAQLLDSQELGLWTSGTSTSSRRSRAPVGLSASRPPVPRKMVKITPLNIAAHIRDHSCDNADDDEFDDFEFEPDPINQEFSAESPREGIPPIAESTDERASQTQVQKRRKGRHCRSHSLDDPGMPRLLNRSATVDAFPYQKVYPQRQMPESVRNLKFDKPGVPSTSAQGDEADDMQDDSLAGGGDGNSNQLYRFHRSVTLHAVSSFTADTAPRSTHIGGSGEIAPDSDIATEISRHPSKAVSPQSPMIHAATSPQDAALDSVANLTLTSASASFDADQLSRVHDLAAGKARVQGGDHIRGTASTIEVLPTNVFQPFIEVRLNDGESGVFLKICRKLKTICATKLAAAAERQKTKAASRKTWSTLRRTASARSIDSEVTADGMDLPTRVPTLEVRALNGIA